MWTPHVGLRTHGSTRGHIIASFPVNSDQYHFLLSKLTSCGHFMINRKAHVSVRAFFMVSINLGVRDQGPYVWFQS